LLQEKWDSFVKFLSEYDIRKVLDVVRNLNWTELAVSPLFWLGVILVLGLTLWKRKFRLLLLVFSFIVFIFLAQYTLPPGGETIPLTKLLGFLGGTVALIVVNLYFLLVREG